MQKSRTGLLDVVTVDTKYVLRICRVLVGSILRNDFMYNLEDILDKILQGNVLEILKEIPSNSIDTIITSPPYYRLRHYLPENNPLKKFEIGHEETLDEYLSHLLLVTKELKRVLKPSGILFWNHGDGYSTHRADFHTNISSPDYNVDIERNKLAGWQDKCLLLQNYRLAIKMVDEQKWILRDVIIWSKKIYIDKENKAIGSAIPSSVRDRCTFTYEPVFMFVKNKKYWTDMYSIGVPMSSSTLKRVQYKFNPIKGEMEYGMKSSGKETWALKVREGHKALANSPNVWQINLEPSREEHYAIFPTKLVERLIKMGCPKEVCKKCGKPRERIIKYGEVVSYGGSNKGKLSKSNDPNIQGWKMIARQKISLGWTDCGCNAGFRPGIVLDPFAGICTTGYVARKMNRHFICIELNPKFVEIGRKRLSKFGTRLDEFLEERICC